MSTPPAFDPHRFQGAAEDYLSGRPAYAEDLVARVAEITGLRGDARVLDLGCGPAQLARAFAPFCAEVLAIDPEPAMLRVAAAQGDVGGKIIFREGSSYDLGPEMGVFALAASGRAFHWMDRAETLARLDGMLAPGGGVVLFSTRIPPALPENHWHGQFEAVLRQYESEASYRAIRRAPGWVPHETLLLDSPFARLETVLRTQRRATPAAALTRRALSMSSTSRARLGNRLAALEAELAAILAPFAQGGMVTEVVESVALIATRLTGT